MENVGKTCSNCTTKYTIVWDEEEQDLQPLTCPFCGYEVESEEESEHEIPEEATDDSWN
jgi:DNA-directed RNA polymerase subunit RPC12/RpoP